MIAGLCILLMISISCSQGNDQSVKLKKGTDVYQFAESLAAKIPYLAPDENNVLVKGKHIKITTGALIQEIYSVYGNNRQRFLSIDEEQLRSRLQYHIDDMLNEILVLKEVEKQDIKVSQAVLDSVIQSQFDQMGGEEAFISRLEKNGLTRADMEQEIYKRMHMTAYFDSVLGPLTIPTEQEISDRYQQDKTASVQHILFLTQGKSDEEKAEIRKKAEEVLAMAKSGQDFGTLAKEYSEDPGSKDNGGLYQDFARGTMVKPFEDAAFNLPIGSISDLVETQYGYHIIKVVDRKKETRPLDEVRDELKAQIEQEKRQTVYEDHMAALKSAANVEIMTF